MLVGIKNCPFGKDFGNNNVQKFYDMLLFCKKEEEVRKYIVLCLFNFFGKEQRGMEAGGGGRKGKKEERAERGREEKGKKKEERKRERRKAREERREKETWVG